MNNAHQESGLQRRILAGMTAGLGNHRGAARENNVEARIILSSPAITSWSIALLVRVAERSEEQSGGLLGVHTINALSPTDRPTLVRNLFGFTLAISEFFGTTL